MQGTGGRPEYGRRRRVGGLPIPCGRMLPVAGAMLLALLAASSSGCMLWPRGAPEDADSPPEDVHVVVHNYNFYDVTIYAHRNGDRRRLGRVTGNSSEEFQLPYRIAASVRFEVRLQAGPTFFTDTLVVGPGEEVVVEIPPHIDRIRVRR